MINCTEDEMRCAKSSKFTFASFSPTIRSSVNHVGSRYIWLKNNMRVLFKPFNANKQFMELEHAFMHR